MKERIRELAEQAVQLVADEHTKGDVSRLNTDSYHVQDLINAKFAELIVKECCFTGEQYADGLFDPKHYAFVNKKIKEHFGVEE